MALSYIQLTLISVNGVNKKKIGPYNVQEKYISSFYQG